MKEKIKTIINWINRNKVVLIVLLIGLGLFYWHSLRPSIIKKGCYNTAMEQAIKKADAGDNKFMKDDYDAYYKWCLQKKGL